MLEEILKFLFGQHSINNIHCCSFIPPPVQALGNTGLERPEASGFTRAHKVSQTKQVNNQKQYYFLLVAFLLLYELPNCPSKPIPMAMEEATMW